MSTNAAFDATKGPTFPRSMMHASAQELKSIKLNLIAGNLPQGLQGYLFLVAPVGSVSSIGLPNPDDSHVWNGNGLIHRFDFQAGESVVLTTRIARTPCYWADFATRPGTTRSKLGFQDRGMARFSIHLGMRNQLNTAFVPMRFENGEATRLLLTFDGGRPYEIDPVSLDVVTPMGRNDEWRPGASLPMPFAPVLSTAHPVFDPETATVYSVNYGRSAGNLLASIPVISLVSKLQHQLAKLLWPIALLAHTILKPIKLILDWGMGPVDFVHLIGWNGRGDLKHWNLVNEEGQPIAIEQTMHQIGVSKDYVILADTSLKFGLEQLLPGPLQLFHPLTRLLRKILTTPQNDYTKVYVVRKSDLATDKRDVIAKCVTLPFATGHFLVDQANPNGRITLHAGHENATDVSEWVRPEDISAVNKKPLDPKLEGMISVGAMDVGRLGRYVIDAEAGSLLESHILHDKRFTWGIGLYALRQDPLNGAAHEATISSIYWQSLGFWPELLSDFIYNLYANYSSRIIPLEDILGTSDTPADRPSTLFRIDTESMKIADFYPFPQNILPDGKWQTWICNSPQFIPRSTNNADTSGATPEAGIDGWIFCLAISEQSKEVWIFDAANLADGPVCRLSHPDFDPGYTIHTAWLTEIESRSASYCVDVRSDYDPLLASRSDSIRKLFQEEIYPKF